MTPFHPKDDEKVVRIHDPEEQKKFEALFKKMMNDKTAMNIAKNTIPGTVSAKFRDYTLWDDGVLSFFLEAIDDNGNMTVVQLRV